MPKKTGWIAALSAHKTVDDREIEESIVDELAQTYDPSFYTARINLEHIRWFNRFGDVLEVKSQVENGIKKLFVKLQVNELLEAINKADQAVFLSVEFIRNFAGTDKAYLYGIALTDQPASVGTGRISLSIDGKDQEVEILNCACKLNYNTEDSQNKTGVISSFIKKLNQENNKEQSMTKEEFAKLQEANKQLSDDFAEIKSQKETYQEELSAFKEQISNLSKTLDTLQEEFAELKNTLGDTLENFTRPPATGIYGEDEANDTII